MVETDVPETRLHLVKLGGPCEIVLDAYPNKRYRGVATELGQRVNRAKATVVVKVKFADDPRERAPRDERARQLPLEGDHGRGPQGGPEARRRRPTPSSTAAARRSSSSSIRGNCTLFPVKLGGPVGASGVELLDGPAPGVKVVAKPTSETTDGQRIKETDK